MCWAVIAMANAIPAASAATSTAFKPVPASTFTNLDGAPVTLSSFRGSVVLINFWGTWCAIQVDGMAHQAHEKVIPKHP